jgi:putative ABC transport system permease protein
VEAVASTTGSLPMSGDSEYPFWLEGQPKPASESEMKLALFYMVQPGYLSAMQIPLHRGRFLTKQDDEHAPPVTVIDEDFAREYFPNEDPIGKRIHVSILNTEPEIIGIVGHVKHWGLDTDGDAKHSIVAQAYISLMQIPDQVGSGPGPPIRR